MINWTSDDRDRLREYLTRSENKLILKLLETLPKMDASGFEETALQAKEFKGASDKITEIEDLSKPEQHKAAQQHNVDVTTGL